MNNSQLNKSLINENRRMDAGLITPARVTEITFDADGKPVRRELDPAEYAARVVAANAQKNSSRRKTQFSANVIAKNHNIRRLYSPKLTFLSPPPFSPHDKSRTRNRNFRPTWALSLKNILVFLKATFRNNLVFLNTLAACDTTNH